MPPKNYKNLPSIKKGLYLDLCEIADHKGKKLSELVHEVLGTFVSYVKGELPFEEWSKI